MQMKRKVMDASWAASAALALMAGADASGASPVAQGAAALAATVECSSLAGMALPNTSILSAQLIPAGSYTPPGSKAAFDDLPAFCRITAKVAPVAGSAIGIELWLPQASWNGRYQQVGTHGVGGVMYWSEMAPQLRRGFATGATDTGHSASEGMSAWAIGAPEKLTDYAYRAVHELADKAKLAIKAYYGRAQSFAYFNGCSKGGGDGMKSAQMYPHDFNGIIAGGAAAHASRGSTAQLIQTIRLRDAGIRGARGVAIMKLAQDAAIASCDGLDGVTDGIIANPLRCHWNPQVLVCQPGQSGAACITPEQAQALAANVSDLRDPANGQAYFPGQSRGSEHDQVKYGYVRGLSVVGLAGYQIALGDAAWDASRFDFGRDAPVIEKVLAPVNAIDPDLAAFQQAGGKLIQWHSWEDAAYAPLFAVQYYEQVAARMGGVENTSDFYRLFMMPAQGHCGLSGAGPSNIGAELQQAVSSDAEHDIVTALQEWVERGAAPRKIVASRFKNGDRQQGIDMQRPLCPYPLEAVYKGSGDTNADGSFYCGTPQPVPVAR